MLSYSDYAIVFSWEILNNKQDIGKWELLFEEDNKEVKGNGMSEFIEELSQLPQNKINVIFVKDLNLFQIVSSSYIGYGEDYKAGVKQRNINFFALNPIEFVEFRNCNNFWEGIDNKEFLRRLTLCRDKILKGKRSNRLSLKDHFKYTFVNELWKNISDDYYLKSSTFKALRERLLPKSEIELDLLLNVYKSSFVFANPKYLHQTLCDVYSKDIKSSHSGFYLRKMYPYSEGTLEEDTDKVFEIINSNYYAWIGQFRVVGLKLREAYEDFPWDMRNFGFQLDDGSWIITLLNPHWGKFKQIYTADYMIPIHFVYYRQKVLDRNYVKMINELYQDKEFVKKATNDEFIINLFKVKTELPYGQSIKRPVYQKGVIYNENEDMYVIDNLAPQTFDDIIHNLRKYALPFQYGVWTAAYSWAEEVGMILDIGLDNAVYGDTDSIYFLGEENLEKINKHNEEIDKEFDFVERKYSLKGIIDNKVGRWLDNGDCICFKTIGRKRYISFKESGDIKPTCAGANIDVLSNYVETSEEPFDDFNKDMLVDGLYKHVSIDRKRRTVHVSYGNQLEEVL